MKLTEIFKLLEKIAPVSLSDEFCKRYGLYDNSGIIINCGQDINGALFSLDLSKEAVDEAVLRGYNLIVTHHPAIYGGISRLDTVSDPLAKNLAECLRRGISVISMHLNFDAAPKGIDYYLMKGLGGEKAEILAPITGGGYGRAYRVNGVNFSDFVQNVKKTFSSERVLAYGDDMKVNIVASFCGAGCDENAISFAAKNNVDVFVSSDLKHHEIAGILARGINVVQLTHYASESYGFNKIYEEISSDLRVPSEFYFDKTMA